MVQESKAIMMNYSVVKKIPAVWQRLVMPDGMDIILASKYSDGSILSFHDINHNVFRFDRNGDVIWQVRRDDSNHGAGWWDRLMSHAREGVGLVGERVPFMGFLLRYPDGSTSQDPETGVFPDIQEWVTGCAIELLGSAYQEYVLDPDTGIAKNVTKFPVRPW